MFLNYYVKEALKETNHSKNLTDAQFEKETKKIFVRAPEKLRKCQPPLIPLQNVNGGGGGNSSN